MSENLIVESSFLALFLHTVLIFCVAVLASGVVSLYRNLRTIIFQ